MGRQANDRPDGEFALTQSGDDKPVKTRRAEKLQQTSRIARFKGATIIEQEGKWQDMSSERFAEACYKKFGSGLNKSAIAELEHLFRTTAPDLSHLAHLVAFGTRVWDMRKLDWTEEVSSEDCVYRVPYEPKKSDRINFVLDLAKGDTGVYDDIMQSVAPLLMDKKPTGVIWYLGTGANGKSTLVHLLYMIFGPYLTEITVKQLEDERDTPQLNGKLGNICKESSEGYVEDTRTYKSIGTHESFSVHKFHSQDMVQIEGNVHHIFSANNIPTFGDKSYGARRRTLVIPFDNRFTPDETFEDRTFTQAFIEQFLGELLRYTARLKKQNYEYIFSDTTRAMKEKYDTDANTAQTYADELVAESVVGFNNFRSLQTDYENWCQEHGYKSSSINVLRKAMDEKGYTRRSARTTDNRVNKVYVMGKIDSPELVMFDKLRPGIFKLGAGQEDVSQLPDSDQEELLENF
jgi:putative DNA primase/helicase